MELSESTYILAQNLYSLCSDDINQNIFISPLSISMSLAMVILGAKENTKEELLSVLSLGVDDACQCQLFHEANQNVLNVIANEFNENILISNKIFIQENEYIVESYLSELQSKYLTSCAALPFGSNPAKAADEINSWVSESTKGKITELVNEADLGPLTTLIVANAVYFKSFWAQPFLPSDTEPLNFTLLNGEKIKVKMMFQSKKFRLCEIKELRCDAIELPYKDGKLKMIIFLPRELDGLREIEEAFSSDLVKKVEKEGVETLVDLWLPSFKFDLSYKLKPIMQKLGVLDAFVPGRADFSGISGNKDLYIGSIIHKTFVHVNEEGTEAAAVTKMKLMKRCLVFPDPFKADHPFLFAITDTVTKSLLFVGSLKKPEAISDDFHFEL